ncbi:hypothetical protein Tco_1052326, partial [Tanacetum coccineum]
VSPWKSVLRFKNNGKLSPRFIGPFKVLKRAGEVAYVLELPKEMRGTMEAPQGHKLLVRTGREDEN